MTVIIASKMLSASYQVARSFDMVISCHCITRGDTWNESTRPQHQYRLYACTPVGDDGDLEGFLFTVTT